MPTYCFRDEHGAMHEFFLTIRQYEADVGPDGAMVRDGIRYVQDVAAQHGRAAVAADGGCAIWPMRSDAAGVHPSQAREAMEHSERIGVRTEFCPRTGQAIFRDRAHRKAYNRAYGFMDKDGGYGD